MNRSSKIKSALYAARKYRRKTKRYDEGGEVGDVGELGGLGMGTGASIGDLEGSAVGSLGGITGGLGISLGDLEQAMNAPQEGVASYGGQYADGIPGASYDVGPVGGPAWGGGPMSGYAGIAGPAVGGPAYGGGPGTGYAGLSGAFDVGVNPAAGFGVATFGGDPTQGNIAGVPAEGAFGSNPGAVTQGDYSAALAALANGLGSQGKGDALGPVGMNLASGIDPAAGFGVASFGNSANQGSVAGVPAETTIGTNVSGTNPTGPYGGFADFGQFTEGVPGVTVANNAAVTSAALDAFGDRATGPSPDPNSGIQTTIADAPTNAPAASAQLGNIAAGHNSNPSMNNGPSQVANGPNPSVDATPSTQVDYTAGHANDAQHNGVSIADALGLPPGSFSTGNGPSSADIGAATNTSGLGDIGISTDTTTSPVSGYTSDGSSHGISGVSASAISAIAAITGIPSSTISAMVNGTYEPTGDAREAAAYSMLQHSKRGGRTRAALHTAKKYAKGGKVREPHDHEFTDFASGGHIKSAVPGRTDKLPLNVKSGAYVIPASVVSGLGEGNTQAGVAKLDKLFQLGPYGAPTHKIATPHVNFGHPLRPMTKLRADGGGLPMDGPSAPLDIRSDAQMRGLANQDPVKIIAAGGEYVVPPHVVKNLGGGDMNHGHDILDQFVMQGRKNTIKDMKNELPPKRD